ncbi:uncharacterized protein TNCV_2860801 [Trichonephila clavipes]|nr:uncharacterized protein TNCV_2860801 [Trichonephila clavipes]
MPRKHKSNLSQRSNSARAMKVARFNETFPQAGLRRLEQAERDAAHKTAETPERSQARRRRQAEYLASQRATETPEQSQARRLQHATYMASQRDAETIEAAESRKRAVAERAQQRRQILKKNTWGVFDKAAFKYDETLDYESNKLIKIEAMNKEEKRKELLNGKRNLQACVVWRGGSSHNFNWRGQGRQCSHTTHPNHTQ